MMLLALMALLIIPVKAKPKSTLKRKDLLTVTMKYL